MQGVTYGSYPYWREVQVLLSGQKNKKNDKEIKNV